MSIAVGVHPDYPFILVFNRDESFERPALPIAEYENGIYGKDEQGGGTWLCVNRNGQWAGLTNFKEETSDHDNIPSSAIGAAVTQYKTRGVLPIQFAGSENMQLEIQQVIDSQAEYKSFNLVAGNMQGSSTYLGVKLAGVDRQEQGNGVYCVSNGAYDCDWPKVHSLKETLKTFFESGEPVTTDALFEIMRTTGQSEAPSENIFVPVYQRELFGTIRPYGTISTTIILKDSAGTVTIVERQWEQDQINFSQKIITL